MPIDICCLACMSLVSLLFDGTPPIIVQFLPEDFDCFEGLVVSFASVGNAQVRDHARTIVNMQRCKACGRFTCVFAQIFLLGVVDCFEVEFQLNVLAQWIEGDRRDELWDEYERHCCHRPG